MYDAFDLPKTSDLCCYWFEMARRAIEKKRVERVGLLATQGIRGGFNREVLERIKRTGDIFVAWSDRPWILDGASVHVSIVGFDDKSEIVKCLDGVPVKNISADLATTQEVVDATPIVSNEGIAFMGITPSGQFQIEWAEAADWLGLPNPNRRMNKDVLRPWMNAKDLTDRYSGEWIIDFGVEVDHAVAAQYEAPFQHIVRVVAPARANYRTGKRGYWCFERPRPEMREALAPLRRYLATPLTAKFRPYAWIEPSTLPANLLIVFARSDDYFFGVLHSCVHEVWARRMGTQLREAESGFRYTPTTCFETFPLPWGPGKEPSASPHPAARSGRPPSPTRGEGDQRRKAPSPGASKRRADLSPKGERGLEDEIAAAAKELNELRENWLNPPEWIESVGRIVDNTYRRELEAVPKEVRPLVRRSAVMAAAAKDVNLKKRTLTNLYNERPEWLKNAHERLDRAVIAAYAAVDPDGDWHAEWAMVFREFGAGEIEIKKDKKSGKVKEPAADAARKQAAIAARAPVVERVLANLLRLNGERAGEGE